MSRGLGLGLRNEQQASGQAVSFGIRLTAPRLLGQNARTGMCCVRALCESNAWGQGSWRVSSLMLEGFHHTVVPGFNSAMAGGNQTVNTHRITATG